MYELVNSAISKTFSENFDNSFVVILSKTYLISSPLLFDHISMDNPFSSGSYKPANLISDAPKALFTNIFSFCCSIFIP